MNPDPHYHLGSLSMAAALAVKALPQDPRWAKRILQETLREYLPNASEEHQERLKREGVR